MLPCVFFLEPRSVRPLRASLTHSALHVRAVWPRRALACGCPVVPAPFSVSPFEPSLEMDVWAVAFACLRQHPGATELAPTPTAPHEPFFSSPPLPKWVC